MITNNFASRHIGPRKQELAQMLEKIGVSTVEELIAQTIPASIRLKKDINVAEGLNEFEYFNLIKEIGQKNKLYKSYIGMGYYNTITPGVILRNILENPGWYTAYTPYQAEISQGRLEALLNFQTMISDLTAMPMANASLLDEATAASEAMIMSYNSRPRKKAKAGANKYFVSDRIFPQTIDVLKTRALPIGIELVIGNFNEIEFDETFFGAIIQYPDERGNIENYADFTAKSHASEVMVTAVVDIMALALLTPPGEWDADIVVGSTQRFGVPMGYGGPHAGYLAAKEEYKRTMPGRIIGVSIDKEGNPALRMALQTREQHIKREKATSNICTAQALLAIMAQFYAAYHGQEGIRKIARHINILTGVLASEVEKYGY
ncbi:MAG: glycine dehydrogenase (aminomethyl-transferring), partial [Bacteroidales bacterium]|nr:glycine dehydrogenase (aminomethyl-transferring) [Bacteroidales bacterium]